MMTTTQQLQKNGCVFFVVTLVALMMIAGARAGQESVLCDIQLANPNNKLNWPAACAYPTCSSTLCSPCASLQTLTCTNKKIVQIATSTDLRLSILPETLVNLTSLLTLNIQNNQISVLPSKIGLMTQLTNLNLYNNYLTGLPESIGSLTALTSLELGYCPLSTLPDSIGSLKKLKYLRTFSSQLPTFPASISSLTALTSLTMAEDNNLTSIPEPFGPFPALTYLYFGGQYEKWAPLSALPASMANLSLLSLTLYQSKFSVMPESIFKIKSLTGLYFSRTSITTIPASINSLTNLNTLTMHSNPVLNKIVPDLSNLAKLSYINIVYNYALPGFHDGLCQLKKLQFFNVTNARLTALPSCIGGLSSLTAFIAGLQNGNLLSVLPTSFFNLSTLTWLDLGNVGLKDRTYASKITSNMPLLRYLDLSGNAMNTAALSYPFPDTLRNLPLLNWFSIENGKWSSLPDAFSNLTRLTYMSLLGNYLTALPASVWNLTALTVLNVAGNKLTSIPNGIAKLTKLGELYVHSNQLTQLPDVFKSLKAIHRIRINTNSITSVPDSFGQLTLATGIYMNNNKISALPTNLNWTALIALDASYNRLRELPVAITRCTNAQTINLGYNRLSVLPIGLASLPKLVSLTLTSNCLDCDAINQMAYTTYIKSVCVKAQQNSSCVVKSYVAPNNTKFTANFVIENDPGIIGLVDGKMTYSYDTNTATAAHLWRNDYTTGSGYSFSEVIVAASKIRHRYCSGTCETETYSTTFSKFFVVSGVDAATGTVDASGCAEYTRGDTTDPVGSLWVIPKTMTLCKAVFRTGKTMTFSNYKVLNAVPSTLTEYKSWTCVTPTCTRKVDIVLMIDESGSLDATLWAKEMSFASQLVDSFTVSSDSANFGIVYFSTISRTVLSMTADAASIKNVLQTTARRGGQTCISTGLTAAWTLLNTPLSGRAGASKVLIAITDGNENCNGGAVTNAAAVFPSNYTRLAISPSNTSYSTTYLTAVAGTSSNVILATFATLAQKLDTVVQLSCATLSAQQCGSSCYGICGCNKACYCPRCANSSLCSSTSCTAGQNYNSCHATTITCPDDKNACTYSQCIEGSGCKNLNVSCVDESKCTQDLCDVTAGCRHPAVDCDDDNKCTEDYCDYLLGCVHTNVTCDDYDECTIDSCSASLGCIYKTRTCNDGLACTTDSCDSVKGCYTTPVVCNATDQCFDEKCDESRGGCYARDCDDQNICFADSCDTQTGCVHTIVECGPCTKTPINCSLPIHKRPCYTAACGSEDGSTSTCLYTSWNTTKCNSNNKCILDGCDPATETCIHTAVTCEYKACKTASCNSLTGECNWEDVKCTTTDPCKYSYCDTTLDACVVAENNTICTDYACSTVECVNNDGIAECEYTNTTCDYGTACLEGYCDMSDDSCHPRNVTCDDGLFCTVDTCDQSIGCMHSSTTCDDSNECTTDTCVEGNATCFHTFGCDDGLFCTTDSCLPDGSCLHAAKDCSPYVDVSGSSCFVVACNEEKDKCQKKVSTTAQIDVCGSCINYYGANSTVTSTTSDPETACLATWVQPTVVAVSIGAAAIAGIVIAAVVAGLVVLLIGSIGTYELVRRANLARSKTAVSNPLYQAKQNEGVNPVFEGTN